MKKITLMLLVAMVPFLTMAQKRSKKGKEKTEKIDNSNATYEFMVISGYQKDLKNLKEAPSNASGDVKVKQFMKSATRISFDFGGVKNNDTQELYKNARNYKSMAAAVNGAANYGWEFVSANTVNLKDTKVHYYYMKRSK